VDRGQEDKVESGLADVATGCSPAPPRTRRARAALSISWTLGGVRPGRVPV